MSKILIAEDEMFLAKALKTKLETEGFEVIVAGDGAKALSLIQEDNSIGLILLDMVMPEIDGFTVLKKLHEQGNTIPVVILSNLSQATDREKIMELGAKDYMVKSNHSLAEIVEKVKSFVH